MSNSPQPKWDPPNNPLICLCFTVLCWVSVGDESLKPTWEAANPRADPDKWAKYRKRIVARITSITVVAGLLLATTAVFLTTTPPNSLMLYNTYGAYSFMTAAFGAALGGLIMGSTQLYLMSTCTPWRYRRLLGYDRWLSRLCLLYNLVLMAYPSASIGCSIIFCATSLVLAGWDAGHLLYKIGTLVLLGLPTISLGGFVLNFLYGMEDTALISPRRGKGGRDV